MHLLGDLGVPPLHVAGLLGVERVGDGAQDEDVRLDATLSLLLLALLLRLQAQVVHVQKDRFGLRRRPQLSPGVPPPSGSCRRRRCPASRTSVRLRRLPRRRRRPREGWTARRGRRI